MWGYVDSESTSGTSHLRPNRRDFLGLATGAIVTGSLTSDKHVTAGTTPPAAKSAILILNVGGPSQLDTWDPKPHAPSSIASPWRPIATRLPGVYFTELFPRLADLAHELLIVRSMTHTAVGTHEVGQSLALTGALPWTKPLPPTLMEDFLAARRAVGRQARVTVLSPPSLHARDGYPAPLTKVFEEAAQLASEDDVCVVLPVFASVFDGPSWDMHGMSPFTTAASWANIVAPAFDDALAALIRRLRDRCRLGETLVACLAEFGRTPHLNPAGGRDHWPGCWTTLLAGGGLPAGVVIGASDNTAAAPNDEAMTPVELRQLIAQRLGICTVPMG